jgi:hypothetical protein
MNETYICNNDNTRKKFVNLQTPTSNNLIGPKPFGGSSGFSSNLPSTPTLNSGSTTLPRLQSQSVTGKS